MLTRLIITMIISVLILVFLSLSLPQTYLAPGLSIFGDFTKDASVMYNNFRVYGTILLCVMGECSINPPGI